MSLLLLGATGDLALERLAAFCWERHEDVQVEAGEWGDPPPRVLWTPKDYLISYRSRWIVPPEVLRATRNMAINFHPGPPEYPGYAPACWALYHNAATFGVTCHQMTEQVDAGTILAVSTFSLAGVDTVAGVLQRAHTRMEVLAYDVVGWLLKGYTIMPVLQWTWGTIRTRADLERLATLTPDMTEAEMRRRIRAVTYGPWRARMVVHGITLREDGA